MPTTTEPDYVSPYAPGIGGARRIEAGGLTAILSNLRAHEQTLRNNQANAQEKLYSLAHLGEFFLNLDENSPLIMSDDFNLSRILQEFTANINPAIAEMSCCFLLTKYLRFENREMTWESILGNELIPLLIDEQRVVDEQFEVIVDKVLPKLVAVKPDEMLVELEHVSDDIRQTDRFGVVVSRVVEQLIQDVSSSPTTGDFNTALVNIRSTVDTDISIYKHQFDQEIRNSPANRLRDILDRPSQSSVMDRLIEAYLNNLEERLDTLLRLAYQGLDQFLEVINAWITSHPIVFVRDMAAVKLRDYLTLRHQ